MAKIKLFNPSNYGTFTTSQSRTAQLRQLLQDARYLLKGPVTLENLETYNTKMKEFKILVGQAQKDLKNGHIEDPKEIELIQHCAKFAKQLKPRIAALDKHISSLKIK